MTGTKYNAGLKVIVKTKKRSFVEMVWWSNVHEICQYRWSVAHSYSYYSTCFMRDFKMPLFMYNKTGKITNRN